MPCSPLAESQFSPPNPGTFPGAGGFAPSIPALNIPFPDIPLDDLTALFDALSMILPPGILKPHFEPDFLNDVYGAINSILEKFMPFLMLYKFFLPVLNLILCIIEVLCSLTNPFKMISAMRRLFRVCIPEFLALFPFFALPLMIISLLLLILALIQYLLTRILEIIEVISANITLLGKAASRLDNDSIIGIVKKIGDLLCLLQNLFVIFGVITLILQLIKAMLGLDFKIPPCDDSDPSGCCTADVCPDFLKNNETITGTTGNFLYYNQVGIDSGLVLPTGFPPIVSSIRNESWQFYDPNLSQRQAFINITNAYDLPAGTSKVFFPGGVSYTDTTSPPSTPYTIEFRFFYNPLAFGASDPKGARYVRATNVIVQSPPTVGVKTFDNSFIAPLNGTLNLIGGVMTEDNGTPILNSQGNTIPLNQFIHEPVTSIHSGSIPFNEIIPPNDGYLFSDLTYTFTINHEVLLGASLITLGCIPEVNLDKNFINTTIGSQFNVNGVKLQNVAALLPDATGAQNCIANAITTYRQNISVDSTNQFQAAINNCLTALQQQTNTALAAAVAAGFDQYKSSFSLDTSIQFTTQPIKVIVSLNDSSGQSITNNLTPSSASSIGSQLSANITLGSLSSFAYDGYQFFTADITSSVPGNGQVEVAFDNNFISILSNPSDLTQSGSVSIKQLSYTFVESPVFGHVSPEPIRDEGDVARAGGNG